MSSTEREPCPWRIIEDAGGAFAFGMVGGTVWHFVGGARNAPSGLRFAQAIGRVKARTPILGGSFAVWGLFFSCFECAISSVRKKEDPWNGILSGAATGGVLAARAGIKAAAKNAAVGGVLLAAIEGLGVVMQRVLMPMMTDNAQAAGRPVDLLSPPDDPLRPYRPPMHSMLDAASSASAGPMGVPSFSVGAAGGDSGGVATRPADEFDFVSGRYKSEDVSEASEKAANAADAAKEAEENKTKGWW